MSGCLIFANWPRRTPLREAPEVVEEVLRDKTLQTVPWLIASSRAIDRLASTAETGVARDHHASDGVAMLLVAVPDEPSFHRLETVGWPLMCRNGNAAVSLIPGLAFPDHLVDMPLVTAIRF